MDGSLTHWLDLRPARPPQWRKKSAGNLTPAGFISNSKCYF